MEEYKIEPKRIVDLKAIMGDASDNIPGVKGIGEKGALKLLQEYESLENVYENIDNIKGSTKEKLINGKDSAFMSKKIATIYKDVPINVAFEAFKYNGPKEDDLIEIFEELEFFSFLKKLKKVENDNLKVKTIYDIDSLVLDDLISLYIEVSDINYHKGSIVGLSVSDKNNTYFIRPEDSQKLISKIKDKHIITYDLKKDLVKLGNINCNYDLMIAAYLLNYNVKDDISVLMAQFGEEVIFYDNLKKNNFIDIEKVCSIKSRFIYDTYEKIKEELIKKEQIDLFNNIEMPLIEVLSDMEKNGFKVEKDVLDKIKADARLIEKKAVINFYMKQLDCKDLNELKNIIDNLHSLLSTLE